MKIFKNISTKYVSNSYIWKTSKNILHFENIIMIGIVMWKNLHFSETAFALRFSKIVKSNGAQCSKNYKILQQHLTNFWTKIFLHL